MTARLCAVDNVVRGRPPEGAVVRRLSDLTDRSRPGTVYLPHTSVLRRARRAGYDPVLYEAYRDVLAPRPTGVPDDPAAATWFADLVMYRSGTLPNCEPYRSTGHWNGASQVEVFQPLTGRILLLVAGTGLSRHYAYWQVCGPGDLALVPIGAWHLTYVLDGPAAVFNIYTDGIQRHDPGPPAEPAGGNKYDRGAAPMIAAQRRGESFVVVSPPGAEPAAAPSVPWLAPLIPPQTTLAEFYLRAEPDRLIALSDQAWAAHRAGWPTR